MARTPRAAGAPAVPGAPGARGARRLQTVRAAAATDPGRERRNNEDRVLSEPDLGIFAVVDGVGGESAGEVAAATAVDVLRARLSRRTTDPQRLVREAIALANRQIYERAQSDPALAGMACVLTVAVLDEGGTGGAGGAGDRGGKATVGHVGDSRLYVLTPGEIRKATADHSPVGAREDAGDLSEAEAMRHPRRNEIYRDVGSAPHEPEEAGWIDVLEVPFPADSALLLCSDGLSDMIDSREIRETVEKNAGSPDAAVRALIERANAAGGKDNVSAVLVTGDRYAAAVRQAGPIPLRGAARARPGAGERVRGWLGKALAAGLVLAALVAGYLYRAPLLDFVDGLLGKRPAAPLVVGIGDGGYATISEALERAKPGQTVEVAPGQYKERLTLRDGVRVVARKPRTVVLLAPAPPSPLPAVSANDVRGARLSGFRVEGSAAAPWSVGVRLDGSEVELDQIEVGGATGAGIEIRGADRSTVRYSFLHGNGGPGVLVSGEAAPRLLDNLIAGNGTRPGALAPGVEVKEGAVPLIAGNRIEGNGGGGVVLPSAERGDEIFHWNSFGTLAREQAVRSAGHAANPANPANPANASNTASVAAGASGPAASPAPSTTTRASSPVAPRAPRGRRP